MITQYSHQQVTLTDREKEYAWFNYAAEIIKAGCRDQSMSGYQVTGTGSDGKPVTVELTKEELFQIFAEVTTKLGKKFLRERLQEQEDQIQLSEQSQQDMVPDPLERKDFQIHIIRHELKTRKADVDITWGNNLKVEGLSINSRNRGGVRIVLPTLFGADKQRTELISVGEQLQKAILEAYSKMSEAQKECTTVYVAEKTGIAVQTVAAQDGKVIGYANLKIGQELQIQKARIWNSGEKHAVMYPSEAMGSGENRKWHNLAYELPDCRLHERILQQFEGDQRMQHSISQARSSSRHHYERVKPEPEEDEELER